MQQFLRDLLPRRPFSRYRSGHAYRAFADSLSERVYALGLFLYQASPCGTPITVVLDQAR
jgi:hypothetical protein